MIDYEFSHWDGDVGIGKVFIAQKRLIVGKNIQESEFPLEYVTEKTLSHHPYGYYYWGPIKGCFVDARRGR